MDKLQDVREWLNIIAADADSLLRTKYGSLDEQQLYEIHAIRICVTKHLLPLLPRLNDLLETHSISDAVKQLGIEWDVPLSHIKGYSYELLMSEPRKSKSIVTPPPNKCSARDLGYSRSLMELVTF